MSALAPLLGDKRTLAGAAKPIYEYTAVVAAGLWWAAASVKIPF